MSFFFFFSLALVFLILRGAYDGWCLGFWVRFRGWGISRRLLEDREHISCPSSWFLFLKRCLIT